MKKHDRFWNRIAEGYAAKPVADEVSYKKKLAMTQEYFTPDSQVLEFGCGTGTTTLIHAPHVKHILATDLSSEMVRIARNKANAENVRNVRFECTSIEDLQLEDESLDIVMAHSILHLLEDKDAAIEKAYRALKPGGYFVSSTVCITGFMKIIKYVAPIGFLFGLLPLVKCFTKEALLASFRDARFNIVSEWHPAKHSIFVIAQKQAD